MTIEEFDNTCFTGNMEAIFKGNKYEILSVDFETKKIDLTSGGEKISINFTD